MSHRRVRTAEQREVVGKRSLIAVRQILADSAAEEEDQDDRRRDPEGPVEVGVALEHVEEVGAGEERSPAAGQDGRRVHVEELGVEGDGPEEALRGAVGGCRGRREAGGRGLAGAGGCVVEVGVVKGEVLLEVGVAKVALLINLPVSTQSCDYPLGGMRCSKLPPSSNVPRRPRPPRRRNRSLTSSRNFSRFDDSRFDQCRISGNGLLQVFVECSSPRAAEVDCAEVDEKLGCMLKAAL